MGVKDALAEKTENKGAVKLTKSMSIADMIKASLHCGYLDYLQ